MRMTALAVLCLAATGAAPASAWPLTGSCFGGDAKAQDQPSSVGVAGTEGRSGYEGADGYANPPYRPRPALRPARPRRRD